MPVPIILDGPHRPRRRARRLRHVLAVALVLLACLLPAAPYIAGALAAYLRG
jgi:hypothetical protein